MAEVESWDIRPVIYSRLIKMASSPRSSTLTKFSKVSPLPIGLTFDLQDLKIEQISNSLLGVTNWEARASLLVPLQFFIIY